MQANSMTRVNMAIPSDCFELVKALVSRLGGELIADDENTEFITVLPMPEKERPGRMLKGLRLREGMTQKQIGAAIGVPQSHIAEYEKGKRPIPAAKAALLAEILKSVPENFLQGRE